MEKFVNIWIVISVIVVSACGGALVDKIYHETQEESDHKKVEIEQKVSQVCFASLVDMDRTVSYLKGLDTNGVSCAKVVNHLTAKYNRDLRDWELNNEIVRQRYEELKKVGRKYYELTKDTSVIRLLY
jgi:hypothetical protein